jgi:hypothetical protein
MSCRGTLLNDGWELLVNNGLPPLSLSVQVEHFSRRTLAGQELKVGDLVSVPIAEQAPGKLTSVTPWADWTNDFTQTVVVLENPDRSAAFFGASRDPGVWIEPQTDLTKEISGRNQKSIPLVKNSDGSVGLMAGVIDHPGGGLRRWMTGVLPGGAWETILEVSKNRFTEVVQRQIQPLVDKRQLDRVKDFVLEWPEDPGARHPMLIVNNADIERCRSRRVFPQSLIDSLRRIRGAPVPATPDASDSVALATWLLTGAPQAAVDTRIAERLRQRLGLLGNFDLMRSAPLVATLYDGVIDSGLLEADERRLLRARMAFLAYRMEDPATWSAERGFNTGLPNMNVAYALGRGIVAAALPDHPRAATWSTPALERMDDWLENTAGSRGEWIEGASYDHVAASTMLAFAIAAKNAGFRDYSRHEKFRLLIEYIAKQYTPPDPTRDNLRVTPPLGRANAGIRMGLFGVMARFCRDAAPAYSAEMQWMWRQTGSLYPLADNRLCGLEYLYIDPELPGQKPQWTSEWFPRATAVLRNEFGTADEDYANFLLHAAAPFARASEPGSLLSWFAFGKPVAGAFVGGYAERHELLMSRVAPAMSPAPEQWRAVNFHKIRGDVKEFSSQPQFDYIDSEYTMEEPSSADWLMPEGMPAWPPVARRPQPPIAWRRQVAFVKGAGKGEPSYLVLRDTVSTDQPTQWQFWTLSNGIAEAGDFQRPRGIIPDRLESRPLRGSTFTAFGQQGVDLDFFVLEPAAPEASTLRWGTTYRNPPDPGYTEHRDLLQVRRMGSGSYTVVIIPRLPDAPRPTVDSDADGRAIRIDYHDVRDMVVFGDAEAPLTVDTQTFVAPLSFVRQRAGDAPETTPRIPQ